MRQRKPAHIKLDLQRWAQPIVQDPAACAGSWRERFMPEAKEIRLDLGCGKGSFITAAAQAEPDVLFVGLDMSDTCIARVAEKVVDQNLKNVRLVLGNANDICTFFAPGELDRIYLNFNSPFPKAKYAEKRLAHLTHLLQYRSLVGETGLIDLRTDNVLYWDFALGQLQIAGYRILMRTDDLHKNPPQDYPGALILTSEYDERTVARGARVRWLMAQPGPQPSQCVQTAPMGLTAYLPEDLESFKEVPYGMEDTLTNMLNQRANERDRHARSLRNAQNGAE